MRDIFPELANGASAVRQRRKMPAKFRDPQNSDEIWTGVGRSPKWVQLSLPERGIDMAAFKRIPMYQVRLYHFPPTSSGKTLPSWQRSEGTNLVLVEAARSTSDATEI